MTATERLVTKFMKHHECPNKYIGFLYLKDALTIVLENHRCRSNMAKDIYPRAADEYNTSVKNIERCLRHLVDKWWQKNQCGKMFDKRPTNTELLYECIERIKESA